MRLRYITLCFATTSLLGVISGDATESRLRIEVTPRVSAAPAMVRVRAIVTPDASNRALQIVADSGSFYRSSMVPLDGANAAMVTETTIKNLPGGDYDVTVTLVEADGKRRVDHRSVMVTSSMVD
jgi:hypothetical protein